MLGPYDKPKGEAMSAQDCFCKALVKLSSREEGLRNLQESPMINGGVEAMSAQDSFAMILFELNFGKLPPERSRIPCVSRLFCVSFVSLLFGVTMCTTFRYASRESFIKKTKTIMKLRTRIAFETRLAQHPGRARGNTHVSSSTISFALFLAHL